MCDPANNAVKYDHLVKWLDVYSKNYTYSISDLSTYMHKYIGKISKRE